jgi:hypothetical protein
MPSLAWSSLFIAARRQLHRVAEHKVRRVLDRLLPVAEPPPPPALPRMDGPELARHRLGEAASALLGQGASQAEAFRLLRLELNRLEQGGLR